MAIRKITWTVGSDCKTVTPVAPQDGGVQGENAAAEVVFDLTAATAITGGGLTLYIECIDAAGGYDKTPPLAVTGGKVTAPVPLAWTQYGGISTLRLVGEKEGQIVYTLEGRLRFAGRQTAAKQVDSLLRTHIQQTLDEAAGYAAAAEDSAQLAQEQAAFIRESMGEPLLQEKESADLLVVEKQDVSAYAQTLEMRVVSKNLIPFPYPELSGTGTVNGITYTVREDGSILVDGTATAKTSLYLLRGWEPELGQVYYHSGCPAGGGYATYQLQLEATDGSFTRFDLGAGAINSFKVEKEGLTVDLYIDIYEGVTLHEAVFYPQLEKGEAATAYTPYLADPTAVAVRRHGRNLFDPACVLETAPAGFPAGGPVYYLKCAPDTAYYISRDGVYSGDNAAWVVATSPDEPGAGMTCTVLEKRGGATHGPIVTPADARYLVLAMGYIDKMQVELGTVQTEYVPYAPPREYIPETDGTVTGVATVEWDTLFEIADPGAVLECVYKRDINNGFAEFEQIHAELRKDVDTAQKTADAATKRLNGLKQADWEEDDTTAQPYIKNKPPLAGDSNNGVVQTGTKAERKNEAANSSTALGAWNKVRKGFSLADGWGNQVDAEKSAAFGAYNLLHGNANLANGRSNEARGYGGAVLGQDSVSAADNAVTLGQSLLATAPAQVVAGCNNAEEPGALLIVGNGNVHRHNALAVLEDGSLMAGAGFETAVRYADTCVLQTFEGMADTVLGLEVSGGTVRATATEDGTVAQVNSTTNAGGVRPQMLLTDRQGNKLWIEQGESFTLSFKVKAGDEDTLARKLFYWLCVTESETGFTGTTQKNACVVCEESSIPFEEGWMTQTVTVTDCPYSGWLRLGVCTNTVGAQSVILLDDIQLVRGSAVVYNYIAKNSDYRTVLYKLCEVQSTVDKTEAWLTGRTLYMADGSEVAVTAEDVAVSQREDRLDNLGNTILVDADGDVLLAIVTRISPDDPDVHQCMDVHEHGVYVSPRVAGVTYEKALSRRIDVSAGDGGGVVVDSTLTQGGFAADAAVTGQKLTEVKQAQTATEERLKSVKEDVTALETDTTALENRCRLFGALNFQENTTQTFTVPDDRAAFLFGITFNGGHTGLYFVCVNWSEIIVQQAIYKSGDRELTFSFENGVLTVTCETNYSWGFYIRGR